MSTRVIPVLGCSTEHATGHDAGCRVRDDLALDARDHVMARCPGCGSQETAAWAMFQRP
jgi:hypothetical protein